MYIGMQSVINYVTYDFHVIVIGIQGPTSVGTWMAMINFLPMDSTSMDVLTGCRDSIYIPSAMFYLILVLHYSARSPNKSCG